jgi:hypothetical protein
VKTPILGSSYVARSVNAADGRMVNLFPEIVPEAGKEPAFLQRCPGSRLLKVVGAGPIRGIWVFGNNLYVASGGALYKLDFLFNEAFIGPLTGSGPVSMSDNGTQLFVACNPDAFIYNTSTGVFSQITDPDFPGAVTVGYLDGYFVFNEPNSQRFWVTSLNDGTAINPLDFASAEGNPDDVVSLMVDHREVWLFGKNTVEVWYNAGLADFPLARIDGAFMETGCLAPYSVAKLDNSVFWLGSDARGNGIVYRNQGYNAQRVSTHAIEWQIQQYKLVDDATAFTYQQDGHSFYVLTFPSANATWVFDVSTNAWHERAFWKDGKFVKHGAGCQANFNNQIILGDNEKNYLFTLDLSLYKDFTNQQRWLRSWRAIPTGQNTLKRTAQHTLQLDCEAGGSSNENLYVVQRQNLQQAIQNAYNGIEPDATLFNALFYGRKLGDINNDGVVDIKDWTIAEYYWYASPPSSIPPPYSDQEWREYVTYIENVMLYAMASNYQDYAFYLTQNVQDSSAMLRWSDDGGHTWSNEHWASMGKLGEYGKRVIWRRLGMTTKLRDRVYEISGTDPVKIAIMGAELSATPTSA